MEWAGPVVALLTALGTLAAGFLTSSWLNRRNLANLTAAQAGAADADTADSLVAMGLQIVKQANTDRQRAVEERDRALSLATKVQARLDTALAYIDLLREVIRRDLTREPPPLPPTDPSKNDLSRYR